MKRRRWRTALRSSIEEPVDLEIRHHIEELTERLMAAGTPAEEARREAEQRFGDLARIRTAMIRESRAKERRMRAGEWLTSVLADFRYALRGLRRSPVFAATSVATLSLGLGASAAVFAVLDALLLRPLPYAEPERLVELNHAQASGLTLPFLFADQLAAWEEAASPLRFAFYQSESLVRTDGDEATRVTALVASHDLDETLGLRAQLGRTFSEEDAVPGVNRLMLTWPLWQRLGGTRSILGSTMELDGHVFEIVGVLPRDFKFPVGSTAEAWIALGSDRTVAGRTLSRLSVVTRLPAGMTVDGVQSTLDARAKVLAEQTPHRFGWGVKLTPVGQWRANPDLVRGVWMLAAAVGLMLLVAIANGVNLLLFRSADRAHELAVRVALGGGRSRLLRHILSEGLMIGLAGGLGAVLIAAVAVALLQGILPGEYLRASVYSFRVEGRVLLFTFVLSLVSGLALGLIPASGAVRRHANFDRLRARSGASKDGRLSHALVGLEVALVVTLLAGAGLLMSSVFQLMRVDTGFDADRTIVLTLNLPEARYPTPELRGDFYGRLEERLEGLPEIQAATVATGLPAHSGFSFGVELQAEGGEPLASGEELMLLPQIGINPDYLSVIGGRLLSGRELNSADFGTANVLIDHTLGRALWGDVTPGRRFRTGPDSPWLTVVGVFQHIPMLGLDDRQSPYTMMARRDPARAGAHMAVGIQPVGGTGEALTAVRRAVKELDPDLPIETLAPARSDLAQTIQKPTFLARIMMAVAGTALVLTAVGIYGVLSCTVARRRREMGIRIALGSQPAAVQAMVMRSGLLVTAGGLLLGVGAALALNRLVASLLFGVEPADPLTYAVAIAVVLLTAALASWIPARRATRVDPLEVLRVE